MYVNGPYPFDIALYFDLLLVSPFIAYFFDPINDFTILVWGVMQPAVGYGVGVSVSKSGSWPIPMILLDVWHKTLDSWEPE